MLPQTAMARARAAVHAGSAARSPINAPGQRAARRPDPVEFIPIIVLPLIFTLAHSFVSGRSLGAVWL
jgi:hypothetical protein